MIATVLFFIVSFLFSSAASAAVNIPDGYVHMESMKMRDSVTLQANLKPHPDTMHELTFAIKQSNADQLHDMLMERSTPGRPLYQQWMSNDEVRAVTSNPAGADALMSWFSENGVMIDWVNRGQEYFRVKASIETWERLLHTSFDLYQEVIGDKSMTAIRAESYSLPVSIASHVEAVIGAVDFPVQSRRIGSRVTEHVPATQTYRLRSETFKIASNSMMRPAATTSTTTAAALGPTVLGYVQLQVFNDVGCTSQSSVAYDFAIGPCIPFSASIATQTSSLRFALNGTTVLLNTYNDEACIEPVVVDNTLPPQSQCSYFNNRYAKLVSTIGTTVPPLPAFSTDVNFQAISFFEGTCFGASPVQVQYVAYDDQMACQTNLQCSSDGYFHYGMNSPVNLTTACVTGLANYGLVAPPTLAQQYAIPYTGGSTASQSVFASIGQSFNPADLVTFQSILNFPLQPVHIAANHTTDICHGIDCYEANLDVQYITGMSQGTNTTFWYVNESGSVDPFLQYLLDLEELSQPPMVNSISYGAPEQDYTPSILNQFANEAIKLGLMGVTIVASSGDDGVVWSGDCNTTEPASYMNCACEADSSYDAIPGGGPTGWSGYGYFPSFPASCPYVTAVGATQLFLFVIGTEISASIDSGAGFMTGGGFSSYYSSLSWQSSAVSSYLSRASSGSVGTPAPGYNKQGRGYPDVALNGFAYNIIVNGFVAAVSGTSASAPVFAAMLSTINARRIAHGGSPVGFVNPTLYANAGAFTDITYSDNLCSQSSPQATGASGFYAATGWDPVSGLGSIQFAKLEAAFNGGGSSSSSSNTKSLSGGAIAGITIGVLVAVALLVGIFLIARSGYTFTGKSSGTSQPKAQLKAPLITELTDEWKTTG